VFNRILIANRGEIACRVIRSCRRLGIATVAIYSDADRDAQHVRMADEARRVGAAAPGQSYLDMDTVVAAARATGAEAIHPGYGFLSENADFVEKVEQAGLTFIGPAAETIRRMGSKSEAKATIAEAGVPVVPGYHGADQSQQMLQDAATEIGFPLLIKASAGGGGKGMRIVREADDFAEALASARREARSAFGDDQVILERYLDQPRHIEVQVFGDSHGNYLHLFERDCSSQRRYQKIIEEAPAPGLDDAMRAAILEAGVNAARAVGYRGAGTVELIAEGDEFFFMEMNTRLQVEHPVTEMITGHDLVEWQIRVAAGEPLPLTQDNLRARGHAFEARIYAEDPAQNFLPSSGRLETLSLPAEEAGRVRVDSGVVAGDEITIHYDPMIAKLVVWGEHRDAALARLRRTLAATAASGVHTNLAFLQHLCAEPRFVEGRMHTAWLDRHLDTVLQADPPPAERVLLAAALFLERDRRSVEAPCQDPYSPWTATDAWRPGHPEPRRLELVWEQTPRVLDVLCDEQGYQADLDGEGYRLGRPWIGAGTAGCAVDGKQLSAFVHWHGDTLEICDPGARHVFTQRPPFAELAGREQAEGSVQAPMPGRVIQVAVSTGEKVAEGDTLVILEAMKMELTLRAPKHGVVGAVQCGEGDSVAAEQVLVELEEADDD